LLVIGLAPVLVGLLVGGGGVSTARP
jgi:hypothetical protein